MPVDIDIAHVAHLARLDLSDEELDFYKTQLAAILEHAARVQSLEGEPEVEASHPLRFVNAYRDDQTSPSLSRDEILAQAPQTSDGYFVAPPALEITP